MIVEAPTATIAIPATTSEDETITNSTVTVTTIPLTAVTWALYSIHRP